MKNSHNALTRFPHRPNLYFAWLWATVLLVLILAQTVSSPTLAAQETAVPQVAFTTDDGYLLLAFLDDDLVHFESGFGSAPAAGTSIFTTPMVAKSDYPGPEHV